PPCSGPLTVRKRSGPSGSNTEGLPSPLALFASSRSRRTAKTYSEPSDHQRPSSGASSSAGGAPGRHGSGTASSSTAVVASSSPKSSSAGHEVEFASATAPILSFGETSRIDR